LLLEPKTLERNAHRLERAPADEHRSCPDLMMLSYLSRLGMLQLSHFADCLKYLLLPLVFVVGTGFRERGQAKILLRSPLKAGDKQPLTVAPMNASMKSSLVSFSQQQASVRMFVRTGAFFLLAIALLTSVWAQSPHVTMGNPSNAVHDE